MLSVLQLAERFQACGHHFRRDPWTGRAEPDSWDNVPVDIRASLEARWGDVEALLSEQSPSHYGTLLAAAAAVGIDPSKDLRRATCMRANRENRL